MGVFQHHLSCRPSLGRYVKITAISIDWVCWVDCGFGVGEGFVGQGWVKRWKLVKSDFLALGFRVMETQVSSGLLVWSTAEHSSGFC